VLEYRRTQPGYVSGRMAVVLRLRGGRRFGIGTDEPEALLQALNRAGVVIGSRS